MSPTVWDSLSYSTRGAKSSPLLDLPVAIDLGYLVGEAMGGKASEIDSSPDIMIYNNYTKNEVVVQQLSKLMNTTICHSMFIYCEALEILAFLVTHTG